MVRIKLLHFLIFIFAIAISGVARSNCLNLHSNEEIARCAETMRLGSGTSADTHKESYRARPSPEPQPHQTLNSISIDQTSTKDFSQNLLQVTYQPHRQSDSDKIKQALWTGLWGGAAFGLLAGLIYLINKGINWIASQANRGAEKLRGKTMHDAGFAAGAALKTARDYKNRNFKVCPFCAEKIKKEALVCKHCHRDLT